jgi:3-phosphoglycerate kinase
VGLDAGRKMCALFRQGLSDATKIFLNGPVRGVVEIKSSHSTMVDIFEEKRPSSKVAGCVRVVGGGVGSLGCRLESIWKDSSRLVCFQEEVMEV